MPEEEFGAVYGSGDGSLTLINYAKESTNGAVKGTSGLYSSIFITRNQSYIFGVSQSSSQGFHGLTVVDQSSTNAGSYSLSLPGAYRVSVNPGGSMAMVFVQNSNFAYYPLKLTAAQTVAYSGGPSTWPKAAVDCEPQTTPGWCLFQVQSPDNVDPNSNGSSGLPKLYYGAPLVFDRPVKAVFSADGGTAYVLNCGSECGGTTASVTVLPVAPMIYLIGQQSGQLPKTGTATTIGPLAGASNALVASSTLYVVGQKPALINGQTLYGGYMTVINLADNTIVPTTSSVPNPVSISDGAPGAVSRMLLADDNTLWIGMTKCNNGVRAATGQPYGCLTMVNTTNNTVTMLEPYIGDATGIAAVTGLNKIYAAEGGQVYIYSTVDGSSIDNQYVTVTGTAYDVAYMDAVTDGDNTVY
jgi:LPXTG-motif cell wall-anchored protein